MDDKQKTNLRLEIAHVLFLDMEGYSQLRITEQIRSVQTLNEIVTSTEAFRAADIEGKLIRIPTGDGMALIFRSSPDAPVQRALEIGVARPCGHRLFFLTLRARAQ